MKRASVWLLCGLLLVCSAAPAADETGKARRDGQTPSTRRTTDSHTVRIRGNKFAPAAVTIRRGEKVIWENQDDRDHAIVADDRSFKSGNIGPDGSYEHAFQSAGTFRYGCAYHPREKAKITVEK